MTLTFDNMNVSTTYNCVVVRENTDDSVSREMESMDVNGRSGNFLIDKKRWSNLFPSYFIFFTTESNFDNCKAFLSSKVGYKKLVDSEHSEQFFMARVYGEIDTIVTRDRSLFRLHVTFERKPQKFLNSGNTVSTKTASGSITNPTLFDSRPLLRVYGTGTVGVGSYSLTISEADTYTDIDCEMQDCFKGSVSKNGFVTLAGHKFPVLVPGSNGITLGSGITKVEITPRWYTI